MISMLIFAAVVALVAAALGAEFQRYRDRPRNDVRDADLRRLRNANAQLTTDLAAAYGERDAARNVRDHWKESASTWRTEALKLLKKLEERIAPDAPAVDLGEGDPPSVYEADTKVAVERRAQRTVARALAEGREARAVADDEAEPTHRLDQREDDDDRD